MFFEAEAVAAKSTRRFGPWGALLALSLGIGACASANSAPTTAGAGEDLAAASSEPRQLLLPAEGEPFGSAEGSVFRGDEPLGGCRIRAVLLRAAAGSGRYEAGSVVEVSTDAAGRFRFERLPIGTYKLKWWIPGDTHWIRTLSPDPDFAVREGQNAAIRPIEATRSILGD